MSVGGYFIRRYQPGDLQALHGIERRSTELFRDHGYDEVADAPQISISIFRSLLSDNATWVGTTEDDLPVGYAVVAKIAGFLHLLELAVDPSHGQRGLGTALLETVIAHAAHQGLAGVTLSTFRDIPFNAPFYTSQGFIELDADIAPDALRRQFEKEVPPDVPPSARMLMIRRHCQ